MNDRRRVAVIGGGAIGLCSAFYLARGGFRVSVIDSEGVGGASRGNAGMIVPSHIVPLAAPGVVRTGLRWLLDSNSPFYIKLRPDLELLRWLVRFRAHCTEAHVKRSIPVLRDMSLASVSLLEEIASLSGRESSYANSGLLMLYHTEKGRSEILEVGDLAEEVGLDVVRMNGGAIRELDPEIRAPFEGGIFYRQDGRIAPDSMLASLSNHLQSIGVSILKGVEVRDFERRSGRITGLRTSEGMLEVNEVVLAAGAWSAPLARLLGIRLPVQPAKGYSITLDAPGRGPRIPHILSEEKLTVTPMPGRIRFAGTLALSGFDARIDARRTKPLFQLTRAYRPDLTDEAASTLDVWFGYRPCSPDGLPLIGRMPPLENLTIATGHGMMGITLAPITGRLVADTVQGTRPSLDMAPLRPDRFDA